MYRISAWCLGTFRRGQDDGSGLVFFQRPAAQIKSIDL